MTPTARERQVKDALHQRQTQVAETFKEELRRLVWQSSVRHRYWRRRAKGDPGFFYTTEKVECFGKTGWVSWVEHVMRGASYEPITESMELHKTRNAAKARAWNLYQGWRLAEYGAGGERWGTFA